LIVNTYCSFTKKAILREFTTFCKTFGLSLTLNITERYTLSAQCRAQRRSFKHTHKHTHERNKKKIIKYNQNPNEICRKIPVSEARM